VLSTFDIVKEHLTKQGTDNPPPALDRYVGELSDRATGFNERHRDMQVELSPYMQSLLRVKQSRTTGEVSVAVS